MSEKTITSVEFVRQFGRYHDEAMREPITLTKHGRPTVVILPFDQYERLSQLVESQSEPQTPR
ncbi:type II toxin-antitoxin system prevent-host-death family antitoxin [Brucella haematophila]|uniref:Antitoxin n=1 Tax=Brucella haematophila TaxID=419474 RepID=A0ABX1DRA6_9HYPH|nr:type II toxin-antitoxin system prevent-host-death family antitoxin [Brucella haematophila]NKC05469.1 type II toxin-antitoxin system prevent-host-death family antitoxin [Brucella haematophila]TMU86073.1 type II toxin-antitoxin system prevent-host-death family antitoxin [Brucella haematophila]